MKPVSKPLTLKQRTSSIDTRHDYSAQTWYSVLSLLSLREYFITVDHLHIWRRHLAWAMKNGKDFKNYQQQRYASSMVFMSLLLSTELNILFNSSSTAANVREQLALEAYWTNSFWVGIVIIISAFLTLLSLISTFTAWAMVSAVDDANAHCMFRSSIGQYVAELPGRLIVGAIYTFIMWVIMYMFVLLPVGIWSFALVTIAFVLFVHVISVFSAFGRVIMHSGAMGKEKIFDADYEQNLPPNGLHSNLLAKAKINLRQQKSIRRQYRVATKIAPNLNNSYEELPPYFGEEDDTPTSESRLSTFYEDEISERQSSYGSTRTQPTMHQAASESMMDGMPRRRADSAAGDTMMDSMRRRSADSAAEDSTMDGIPRRRADSAVRFADEVMASEVAESKDKNQSRENSHTNSALEDGSTTRPPRPSSMRRSVSGGKPLSIQPEIPEYSSFSRGESMGSTMSLEEPYRRESNGSVKSVEEIWLNSSSTGLPVSNGGITKYVPEIPIPRSLNAVQARSISALSQEDTERQSLLRHDNSRNTYYGRSPTSNRSLSSAASQGPEPQFWADGDKLDFPQPGGIPAVSQKNSLDMIDDLM